MNGGFSPFSSNLDQVTTDLSFSQRALRFVFSTAYAASIGSGLSNLSSSQPTDSALPSKQSPSNASDLSTTPLDFNLISLNQRRQLVVKAYQTRGPVPGESAIVNPGKYEELCRDIRESENLNIREGFFFDLERQIGNLGFAHQFVLGQHSQQEPPSSYAFISHYASPILGVLVSRVSNAGDTMMRWIYEGKWLSSLTSYQSRQTPKGEESSFDAELIKQRADWTATGKFAFQSTQHGAGPLLCFSFAKAIHPSLVAGLESVFFPGGSHYSMTARYQRSLLSPSAISEAAECYKAGIHYIESLEEETSISELEMVKLSNSLFEPREVFCFQMQSTPMYEFSYIRHISRLFTLLTSLTLSNQPQAKSPYFEATWNLSLQYNAEPAVFSANIANLNNISCILVHAINDMLSLELCANMNHPKDVYKFGYGLAMRF